EKGAIAETIASFDTFCATDTQLLINGVLVVGIFHKGTFDCRGWTKAVLSAGVEIIWCGLEVAGAKLAIAANRVRVHTLNRRLLKNAMRGAIAASHAFLRIDLPNCAVRTAFSSYHPQ